MSVPVITLQSLLEESVRAIVTDLTLDVQETKIEYAREGAWVFTAVIVPKLVA